jgi:hypothetical protein
MAENTPNPLGGPAVPPKPAEAAKVQPKKETVRINLPPKPTASPTIKLPTLAPGAPAPAVAAPVAAPAAPRAAAAAPAAAPVAPARAAAPAIAAAAPKPVAAAPAPRPMAVAGLSGLDKGLAIAAAVLGLAAVGTSVYLGFVLQTGP